MGAIQEKHTPGTEPNQEKIIKTAQLTAFLRTYSTIPYASEIAELTGAREGFYEIGGRGMIPLAPIIEARFIGITDVLLASGIRNIVEIASGISPRGLIMTNDPSINYLETDLPAALATKEELIASILSVANEARRTNLKFCETDALNRDQLLAASNLLPDPVAIVNEGLFQWLDREEIRIVAQNIRLVLGSKKGIWVTSDFLTQDSQNQMLENPEVKKGYEQLSASTGKDVENNVFVNENDIAHFIDETGFDFEEFDLSTLIGKLTSIEKSGADPEQILKILQRRKIYILKPR